MEAIMEIKELQKSDWQGHALSFEYTTDNYYKVDIQASKSGWNVSLSLAPFEAPVTKGFDSNLFEPHWLDASAFGIEDNGKIVAFLEVDREKWSNRLRITNLLVEDRSNRRKGYGRLLIDKAKELARNEGFRAIILETQTCNDGAIGFYLSQGFVYCGMDISCYGNDDVAKNEVRLELIYFIDG
jgi:ribosomal protein S18 acetylase RimI-like enzyme